MRYLLLQTSKSTYSKMVDKNVVNLLLENNIEVKKKKNNHRYDYYIETDNITNVINLILSMYEEIIVGKNIYTEEKIIEIYDDYRE